MTWRLVILAGSLLAGANDWARLASAEPKGCHARAAAAENLKAARACLAMSGAPRVARVELRREWRQSGGRILRAARLARRAA